MFRQHHITVAEGHCPFNRAGQFPDVAGKRVIRQHSRSHFAQLQESALVTPGGIPQEMHGKQIHIVIPFP